MSQPPGKAIQADRRRFLKQTSAGVVSLPILQSISNSTHAALGAITHEPNHHVPADKGLTSEWIKSLYEKGETRIYEGESLKTIGMPIGGIAAGQLYLRGDGTLAYWGLFNEHRFSGYGADNYKTYTPASDVDQGFAVWIKDRSGQTQLRSLNRGGFKKIQFVGEYPLAEVRYEDNDVPVKVRMQAFSPFIPLNAKDSALPATIFEITVENTSDGDIEFALAGWLENAVCRTHAGRIRAMSVNRVVKKDGLTGVSMEAVETPPPLPPRQPKKRVVFETFESGTFGQWTKTGDAFGDKPMTQEYDWQQKVTGKVGEYFVNSFFPDDETMGRLTSPEFEITHDFIDFRVGGGNQKDKTCINLVIDGQVVRSTVGENSEFMDRRTWDVSELVGRLAQIEIVDEATGDWGHVMVDDIRFTDVPVSGTIKTPSQLPEFGSMMISAMGDDVTTLAEWKTRADLIDDLRDDGMLNERSRGEPYPLGLRWRGAVAQKDTLGQGESKTMRFVLSWHFPNHQEGRAYDNHFDHAADVADYVIQNYDRLTGETQLFHKTYYDSTWPHWLLDRLMAPNANLATNTVQWWKNGRFWAWEGVGCCHGTCGHVWNYEHGLARLFPELERSVREMQDLDVALDPESGLVGFRGNREYAADAQAGTILKCYREHLLSSDDGFLRRNWPSIKKAIGYLFHLDENDDGIIEQSQHNTFDINFFGANTFVGSLYLGALRAGEEMAKRMNDRAFADKCRTLWQRGRDDSMKHLWNGEYFIQQVDNEKHPQHQYGAGCLSDQLFGQGWAHQVDLGNLYPKDNVKQALQSIYKYNWASDVAPQNEAHKPQRVFARPGEAGLFTCTWPKGDRPDVPVLYKNEVWTGTEYQVAGHMAWEGMTDQALTLVRAIHDRYDGVKHNPWNEIECGDHYARALASWGVYTGLQGFVYDGPAGRIGFVPRLTPDDFKTFFTAADGWGSLKQTRRPDGQTNHVALVWGKLRLTELDTQLPDGKTAKSVNVVAAKKNVNAKIKERDGRVAVVLPHEVTLTSGQALKIDLRW